MGIHIFWRIGAIVIGVLEIIFRKVIAKALIEANKGKNYSPEWIYFGAAIAVFQGIILIIIGVTGHTHWGTGNPNFGH